jgi:hypothetical protein
MMLKANRLRSQKLMALFMILALAWSVLGISKASAAEMETQAVSPTSGTLGTVFTLDGSNFTPGEKVLLWTTNSSGLALDAGYIIANSDGSIQVRVQTTDPDGLTEEEEGNYSEYRVEYDEDGEETARYLKVILYGATNGRWNLTAYDSVSGYTEVFAFDISSQASGGTGGGSATSPVAATPAAARIGSNFTMTAGGFKPGEKVYLWTTDPNSKALGADFIIADSDGNIQLRIESNDSEGLLDDEEEANATKYVIEYDDDGEVTSRYLRVVLAAPSAGKWYITGQGADTNISKIFTFELTR